MSKAHNQGKHTLQKPPRLFKILEYFPHGRLPRLVSCKSPTPLTKTCTQLCTGAAYIALPKRVKEHYFLVDVLLRGFVE